jgi:hypothetical protein
MNRELISLQSELLCESHKRSQRIRRLRITRLISTLARELALLTSNKRDRALTLAEHIFKSSDAASQDIEIIDGKLYLSTPMYIDVQELSKHVLW